ncbi:protein JTB-like [Ciona intestinalis]
MQRNVLKYTLFIIVTFTNTFRVYGGSDIEENKDTQSEYCWQTESFTIDVGCHICSSHEASLHPACSFTGYIEQVKCKTSGVSIKSCPMNMERETKMFWQFEGVVIVISLISGLVVIQRMRKLNQENIERIQRQISSL